MKKTAILIAAVAVGCGGSGKSTGDTTGGLTKAPTVTVGKYSKVYRGEGPMRVAIVPVEMSTGDDFLVEVSGTDSGIDGVVFSGKVKRESHRTAYVIQMKGESFWIVHTEKRQHRNRADRTRLILPEDYRVNYDLTYNEEDSGKIDTADIVARHKKQATDGTLAKWQDWNREERETKNNEALAKAAAKASKKCGVTFEASIDWSSIDDEVLKDKSISGYCSSGVSQLGRLCERRADAREWVADHGKKMTCSWNHDKGLKKTADGYEWGPVDSNADDAARKAVIEITDSDKLVLSGPNKVHFVLSMTDPKIYYGRGTKLTHHRSGERSASLSSRSLFGAGVYSRLSYDRRESKWQLRCGDQRYDFTELSRADRDAYLKKAKYKDATFTRTPFALARDDRGTYYYVDHEIKEKGGKDFKVYIGKKGAARATNLKDIVDDSKGMIFATKKGDLRLIVTANGGPKSAGWYKGKRKLTDLTVLKTFKNAKLIFEDLGVYEGVRFGTACGEM